MKTTPNPTHSALKALLLAGGCWATPLRVASDAGLSWGDALAALTELVGRGQAEVGEREYGMAYRMVGCP